MPFSCCSHPSLSSRARMAACRGWKPAWGWPSGIFLADELLVLKEKTGQRRVKKKLLGIATDPPILRIAILHEFLGSNLLKIQKGLNSQFSLEPTRRFESLLLLARKTSRCSPKMKQTDSEYSCLCAALKGPDSTEFRQISCFAIVALAQ